MNPNLRVKTTGKPLNRAKVIRKMEILYRLVFCSQSFYHLSRVVNCIMRSRFVDGKFSLCQITMFLPGANLI